MSAAARFAGEPFLEDLDGVESAGLAVCAFLTPGDGYERYARRLAASCRHFALPYSIWLIPVIHHSISLRGSADIGCSKPSFIRACLDRLGGAAVLYVDVDMIVAARPESLFLAQRAGCDFAIYNWLADPDNAAYLPANGKPGLADPRSSFYVFSHRVGWCSEEQLNCSGATQFYADTAGARKLLERWQDVIAANPRSADDQCLNFAFNNPGVGGAPVKASWLDKSYARCPWWPHVRPVILHPPVPALGQPFAAVREGAGEHVVHLDRCTPNEKPPLFPTDGGVDVRTGVVFRLSAEGRPQPVGRYLEPFWVYTEDPPLAELLPGLQDARE
ncbi:MAG: hypothetical protein L6Q83_13800 [Gammaproteobacteria bacterium]|nr:hypothetical protein [Gammaproteobacteria bacterium]